MPKFSYLVPGKQEELELEWHSLWERVEEVARSCPDVFDTVGEIHLWLESWRSVMGSLQDIDSKTESAGLTPVEPSPSLEKLIMEANKKCKSLEVRVYDSSLPVAAQGKTVVGNNSMNPLDKGKSRSGWTVVQDRPQAPPAPRPTSEPPLSMLFQTLHLPNSKETWCPTSYFSPELSKRSTPSPPPSPSPVIVPGWPRANPAARSTSPAPCSVLSSSPALSARSSFTNTHEDWDEIDHFCVGNGPPEFAYQRCRLVLPPTAPPPRPLPNPYQINAQRPQDFNVMSDRELNLSIERRQRDIERTQLEISRKQSEISRAVADITEWVVELRHRREGPRSTWGAK